MQILTLGHDGHLSPKLAKQSESPADALVFAEFMAGDAAALPRFISDYPGTRGEDTHKKVTQAFTDHFLTLPRTIRSRIFVATATKADRNRTAFGSSSASAIS